HHPYLCGRIEEAAKRRAAEYWGNQSTDSRGSFRRNVRSAEAFIPAKRRGGTAGYEFCAAGKWSRRFDNQCKEIPDGVRSACKRRCAAGRDTGRRLESSVNADRARDAIGGRPAGKKLV